MVPHRYRTVQAMSLQRVASAQPVRLVGQVVWRVCRLDGAHYRTARHPHSVVVAVATRRVVQTTGVAVAVAAREQLESLHPQPEPVTAEAASPPPLPERRKPLAVAVAGRVDNRSQPLVVRILRVAPGDPAEEVRVEQPQVPTARRRPQVSPVRPIRAVAVVVVDTPMHPEVAVVQRMPLRLAVRAARARSSFAMPCHRCQCRCLPRALILVSLPRIALQTTPLQRSVGAPPLVQRFMSSARWGPTRVVLRERGSPIAAPPRIRPPATGNAPVARFLRVRTSSDLDRN